MGNLLSHKSCLEKFQPIACLTIPHSVETKIENRIKPIFHTESITKEKTVSIHFFNSPREVINYRSETSTKLLKIFKFANLKNISVFD